MPAAINLHFYRLTVRAKGSSNGLSISSLPGKDFIDFLAEFVSTHNQAKNAQKEQRVWFFRQPKNNDNEEIDGYVRYGVYGFESDLTDTKTLKRNYKRKTTDSELIDLYYQFWHLPGAAGALACFQQFSGRSCIRLINPAIYEAFRKEYPDHILQIYRVMPADVKNTSLGAAPVKTLRLSASALHADRRKNYGTGALPEEFNVTLEIVAKKDGSFGSLRSLNEKRLRELRLPVWLLSEDHFDRATAEIAWNGKRRRIGVYGDQRAYGAFDVTDDVNFDGSGHPTYDSLRDIANDLMGEFADAFGYVS